MRRRERGFIQGMHLLLYWGFLVIPLALLLANGVPEEPERPMKAFAVVFGAALAGNFLALIGLVNDATNSMGLGCWVGALIQAALAFGGAFLGRAITGGQRGSIAGVLIAMLMLAIVGSIVRKRFERDWNK